jgi:cytochrome c peroxidase
MIPAPQSCRVRAGCALVALALACAKSERKPEAGVAASRKALTPPAPAVPSTPFPPVPPAPDSLGPLHRPLKNPTTPAKVALGRRLFFDPALSVDGTRSCYSCHQNEEGTGGHDPTATGARGAALGRHAPALWNAAYLPHLDWDGRADSLEAQAKDAWAGPILGVGAENLETKAHELGEKPEYAAAFEAVFPGTGASAENVVRAIAAYERTLFCGDTAFDRHVAGEARALTADQKAGMDLFIGKAACHGCHTPPFFSDTYMVEDGSYHNVGVGIAGKAPGDIDSGRMRITNNPSDWAAFKTPSLRDVTRSAPYLHDGSKTKLEDVVRFMAQGGYPNPNLDPKMADKHLSDDEIAKLIAFLGALECTGKLTPP